jgi:hypothetical protein
MKVKLHNYYIVATYREHKCDIRSGFIVSAVPVDAEKAKKIAKILYPGTRIIGITIENLTP